jgi:hypothetical protein
MIPLGAQRSTCGSRIPSHISVADGRPVAVAAFAILCTLGIDWSRDVIILCRSAHPQGKSGRALTLSFHKT